jgi:hypothetical protein
MNVPGPDNISEVVAMTKNSKEQPAVDNYFAIIPEWVMLADISKSAVLVYLILQRCTNDETKTCWPSRETIGQRARVSTATVDKCLKELREVGAIQIIHRKKGPGMNSSNLYRLITARPATPVVESSSQESVATENGATETMPLDPQLSTQSDSPKSVALIKEENQRSRTKEVSVKQPEAFEQFWDAYPMNHNRVQATKAWNSALKKDDPENIIAGAVRYRAYREGEDERFTKYPNNWLREELWRNDWVKVLSPEQLKTKKLAEAIERLSNKKQELGA